MCGFAVRTDCAAITVSIHRISQCTGNNQMKCEVDADIKSARRELAGDTRLTSPAVEEAAAAPRRRCRRRRALQLPPGSRALVL